MTSLIARKRFFSQESNGGSSTADLPLLNTGSSHSSNDSFRCDSPPSSGNYGNGYAMDYSRIIPGRCHSTSIVRQRSGQSLSPTKTRPRKSISMFFSSTTSSSSSTSASNDTSSDYSTNGYSQPLPLRNNSGHLPLRTNSGPHKSSSNTWMISIGGIIGFLTLLTLAASTYEHNTQLHHELQFKDHEIAMHLEHAHGLEQRVQNLRTETIHLHTRIEELEHPEPTEEELNIQRKVFHLEHSQEQLHRGIAEQSKRLVVEKFGPGPKYYVELKLAFDPESNIVQDATTEIGDTIWLETADINEMPHTVYFFLEQVSNGVYDNTAFYRNAPSFVQAGPGMDPRVVEQMEASLSHVLYQEHSPKLQHQQYTLGYPGRPGGPDFYLNLQDNSEQPHIADRTSPRHDILLEADPCFARIIRGFNTMERIHRSNIQEEDGYSRRKQHRMVHPVTIVSMKVQHTEQTYAGQHQQSKQR